MLPKETIERNRQEAIRRVLKLLAEAEMIITFLLPLDCKHDNVKTVCLDCGAPLTAPLAGIAKKKVVKKSDKAITKVLAGATLKKKAKR